MKTKKILFKFILAIITLILLLNVLNSTIVYAVEENGNNLNIQQNNDENLVENKNEIDYNETTNKQNTVTSNEIDQDNNGDTNSNNQDNQNNVTNTLNNQENNNIVNNINTESTNVLENVNDNIEDLNDTEIQSTGEKVIEEGIYEIHSGIDDTKLLDVEGQSLNSGANIYIYQRSNVQNQKFKFVYNEEDGTYTIISINSNKAMDVENGETTNGTNVWQYEQNDSAAQKWIAIKNNDGTYSFMSKLKNNLVLDVYNGNSNNCTNVQVYEQNGSNAQKFRLSKIYDVKNDSSLKEGTYNILLKSDSSKVLENIIESDNNVLVGTNDNLDNKKFKIIYNSSDDTYTIMALDTGKVLDVHNAEMINGTKVWQYNSNGTDAQKWIIRNNEDNTYSFISKLNGLALSISDDLERVQVYEYNELDNQKFILKETPSTMKGTKTLENGLYTISSTLNNNQLFDVTDALNDDGTQIQLWRKNGCLQQLFELKYNEDGYYTIISKVSNKVLAIDNSNVTNGTKIIQVTPTNSDAEKWIIKEVDDNQYSIISKCGNYYIDIANADSSNGIKLQMYEGNYTNAQKFYFTDRNPIQGTKTLDEGTYTISSYLNVSKVFDITDGQTTDEVPIQLWQEDGFYQKYFKLVYDDNGYYTIYSKLSKKVLCVDNSTVCDGIKIVQRTSTGSDEEKWIIKQNSDGTYSIISKCNNYYIDVPNGEASDGVKLQMYDGNGTNSQKFVFNKILPEEGEQTIEDGTYRIISPIDNRKAFDVVDGIDKAGNKIQIWDNDGYNQQKFEFEYTGNGYYKIKSKLSNRVLTVESEEPNLGSTITQQDDEDLDTQKWIIKNVGNGLYNIISKCDNFYIAISNTPQNGELLKLDRKNNSNSQSFILINETSNKNLKTIEDGIYKINLKNNKVFDIDGGKFDNYANLQTWANCNVQQQKFRVKYNGDGTYTISAIHSAKALDVQNGGIDIGTNVEQYEINNTINQKWIIQDIGNGYYNIISQANGLYVDISGGLSNNDGTNIQLYYDNGSDAQQFKFTPINIIDEDSYQIQSTINSRKVLDISGGSQDNYANVQLWDYSRVPQQSFKFQAISNEEYTIIADHSNKALDVQNGGTEPGTNVDQYEQNGTENQKWIIQEAGNDSYYIISAANGLCLDAKNGEANNGTNIQIYTPNNTNAQKFKITHSNEIVIVLNPGHGGYETGCANNSKGLVEKNVTLQIARYIRDELSGIPDVQVILTRDGDYQMNLDTRAMIARNNNADLYVSLHINDESSHSARGSQMYVPFYEGQRHYNSEMTKLANLIQEELSYVGIGRNISGGIVKRNIDQIPKYQYLLNGQVVQADYYADIRHAMKGDTLDYGPDLNTETGVPAILVEHCFMNSSDSNYLDSDYDLRRVAQADANAIKRYFGL